MPVGKKFALKTVAYLAKVKQPKVARVELRAGGGLHRLGKPERRPSGKEK